jgi:hypothetical protein
MDRSAKEYLLGVGIGIACGIISSLSIYQKCSDRVIPSPSQKEVQEGYISPNKIKIFCNDLDGNGELETLMRIGDEAYLLREVDGRPVLSTYSINPAEVIPNE